MNVHSYIPNRSCSNKAHMPEEFEIRDIAESTFVSGRPGLTADPAVEGFPQDPVEAAGEADVPLPAWQERADVLEPAR